MDHIFELLLEFFSIHAHSIAFPEVALPAVLRVSNSNFVVYSGFRLSENQSQSNQNGESEQGKIPAGVNEDSK